MNHFAPHANELAKLKEAKRQAAQIQILRHSLGLDERGRGRSYRNHFVTGEGSTDYPHCVSLVEQGLMIRRAGNALSGGDDIFHVTEAGIARAKAATGEQQ